MIEAVIFDLDGVLLDSESVWDEARREYVKEHGGQWAEGATTEMIGMSSTEWSSYLRERLGVYRPAGQIAAEVADRVARIYRARLPLMPGATEAVAQLAARWPLGLASSSNRKLIDLALAVSGLAASFEVTVSSEEVARGKPAPDVYLEAARRISLPAASCSAIEDSDNGILSASAAGMRVIAVPNREFPPGRAALAAADEVLGSIRELTPDRVVA